MIENGLSHTALKAAKKQLLGQLAIASDNAEAQCLNMGKSLLVYGRVDSIEEIKEKIENITLEAVSEVACEMLSPKNLHTIIYK